MLFLGSSILKGYLIHYCNELILCQERSSGHPILISFWQCDSNAWPDDIFIVLYLELTETSQKISTGWVVRLNKAHYTRAFFFPSFLSFPFPFCFPFFLFFIKIRTQEYSTICQVWETLLMPKIIYPYPHSLLFLSKCLFYSAPPFSTPWSFKEWILTHLRHHSFLISFASDWSEDKIWPNET